jgi:uncharacterized membrane protein
MSAATRDEVCAGNEGSLVGHYNDQVLALRYINALALAVWLGGTIVLGAIVAPTTFQVLQASDPIAGRALAGAVFADVVSRFYYVQYGAGALLLVTLGAMALVGPRPKGFVVRVAIVTSMLAVTLYAGIVVLGSINGIQRDVGGLPSRLPQDDARRVRFDELHRLSERLMMLTLVGGLVLLYWEARPDPGSRIPDPGSRVPSPESRVV